MSVALSMPVVDARDVDASDAHDRDVACFSVHGLADAGLVGRVVDVFAKRGWVPMAIHAVTIPAQSSLDADEMVIDLQCRCVSGDHPDMPNGIDYLTRTIAARLRSLPMVQAVYASPRFRASV